MSYPPKLFTCPTETERLPPYTDPYVDSFEGSQDEHRCTQHPYELRNDANGLLLRKGVRILSSPHVSPWTSCRECMASGLRVPIYLI